MNFKHTCEEILVELESLEKLIRKFKEYSEIPKIELDLSLAKLRNVYDQLLLIENNRINVKSNLSDFNQSITEKKKIINNQEKDIFDEIIIDTEENSTIDELVKTDQKTDIEENTELQSKTTKKTPAKEKIEEKTGPITMRYEKIAEKHVHENLSDKFQKKGIKDIRKAISVTDKFMFTKELFNSDPGIYNETIDFINKAKSLKEAEEYLRQHFSWDIRNKAALQFMQIVERKFLNE